MLGRNVLLVNPPPVNGISFTRQGRCQEREDVLGTTKPPYSLALMASLLRDRGYGVRLVDQTAERLTTADLIARLRAESFTPSLILFCSSTPTLDADAGRSRAAQGRVPGSSRVLRPSCVGGAARVDGARTRCRRHDRRRAGGRDSGAGRPGVVRRRGRDSEPDQAPGGDIVPHQSRGSFSDFESMPYPAWDLLPLERYRLPLENARYLIVETSRGCPYSCDFCVAPIVQGHKFRERSAASLVDEIERGYREYGIRHFYLWGDTVTLNAKSFSVFCDELIARQLDIRWFGNARADNLTDPAFVSRLRQSGCWMLSLGIESESDEVRKDMLKRLERQKIQAAIQNMRQAGILSFGFFILGYPGETRATIERTVEYALKLDPDFANFYPAVPYPGTEMYEKCQRDGSLVSDDWAKMEYPYYLLRSGDLDETVVMGAIRRATRRFFLRPSWMLKHAGDILKLAVSNRHLVWYAATRLLRG